MFWRRVRTLTYLFSLFTILNATAQDTEEGPVTTAINPKLSLQDGLSRTSIMLQAGGTGIAFSLGLEYSLIKKKHYSIDLRSSGFIVAHSSNSGAFTLSFGPQLQYGKGVSRLILGLGYETLFYYGREELYDGFHRYFSDPRFYDFTHAFYQMIGYRAQHKHGYFFELSVLAIMNTQGFDVVGVKKNEGLNIVPWGGIAFGYRLPSLAIRNKWKAERPMILRKKAEEKQAKQNEKDEQWRNRQIKIEDRELQGLIGYNSQSDQQTKLPFIPRGRNMFFVEFFGAAAFSLNHEYDFPLFQVKLLRIKTRAGIAWVPFTRHPKRIGWPFSVAIGVKKNGIAVYAEGGTTMVYSGDFSNYYFFGLSSRFDTQKGFSFGVRVFGMITGFSQSTPSQLPIIGGKSGVIPGISMGYRLPNFK